MTKWKALLIKQIYKNLKEKAYSLKSSVIRWSFIMSKVLIRVIILGKGSKKFRNELLFEAVRSTLGFVTSSFAIIF